MMGTRSGYVDFGAMAWIADRTDRTMVTWSASSIKSASCWENSGLSSILRTLEKAGMRGMNAHSWRSKTLVHRIARHIAGHAASLTGLDAIIFTAVSVKTRS
ncbi:hypothetical protein ACNKHO_19615 [Shigella flexneri]